MTRIHLGLALSCALFAAACGGGGGTSDSSGLERSEQVNSLSEEDKQMLCEWSVGAQGGAGTEYECGDGVTLTVQDAESCAQMSFSGCEITVGEIEDCSNAIGNNGCSGLENPACNALFSCGGS